jgi:RimJ/RimL family protein N-acetyltransferase
MAEHGNPDQWGTNYPPADLIKADIDKALNYVCINDGGAVAGVFVFLPGPDPTYRVIDGGWLTEEEEAPYYVVHRLASSGKPRGTGEACLRWCIERAAQEFGRTNIKIDTHRDNIPMQRLLEKLGFVYCGIIRVADGTERLAYQLSGFKS